MAGPGEIVQKEFLGRPCLLGLRVSVSEGEGYLSGSLPVRPWEERRCRDPDRMIRGICEKLDVEVSYLKDLLSRDDYKPYDEHWSDRGHRTVARVIDKIYRD